jgi:hypothetical protein
MLCSGHSMAFRTMFDSSRLLICLGATCSPNESLVERKQSFFFFFLLLCSLISALAL